MWLFALWLSLVSLTQFSALALIFIFILKNGAITPIRKRKDYYLFFIKSHEKKVMLFDPLKKEPGEPIANNKREQCAAYLQDQQAKRQSALGHITAPAESHVDHGKIADLKKVAHGWFSKDNSEKGCLP